MADEFKERQPTCVVSMVPGRMSLPGAETRQWGLDAHRDDDDIASVGNEIRKRVDTLLSDFQDGCSGE